MTQIRYFCQFYELVEGTAMLLEDNLGNINRFSLCDPVPKNSDDILKSDPILIVNPLKKDLKVIDNILLEDKLIDFAVNLDELLKTHLSLVPEDLLEHLGSDCDFVHA